VSTLHIIQHNQQEGLGRIQEWATHRGITPLVHFPLLGEALPNLLSTDKLIVLGGEQNVGDPELHPEQTLLRRCIEKDIAVFGICLGSQLLADALGAPISKLPIQELGWKQLQVHPNLPQDAKLSVFKQVDEVFLWHSYQFAIPEGAIALAETELCKQQGFELGKHVGLQFHPEWQTPLLQRFAAQNDWPDSVINSSSANSNELDTALFALLDKWWVQ
jgi:GMP synthase-like glutamine amidotransferase